jgi:hypothetical protein
MKRKAENKKTDLKAEKLTFLFHFVKQKKNQILVYGKAYKGIGAFEARY